MVSTLLCPERQYICEWLHFLDLISKFVKQHRAKEKPQFNPSEAAWTVSYFKALYSYHELNSVGLLSDVCDAFKVPRTFALMADDTLMVLSALTQKSRHQAKPSDLWRPPGFSESGFKGTHLFH
ncbi:hypothetical protein CEXT_437671 [Caerostris extrusa]|uniref:Uncharacterized protein n=1 Tax=Caerostris extrusa TaxID=172846 RepID=A0AAV4XIR4_CAEEX|nr:hypothetical protein CEXT_437671 [Caerostris extrusa]